MAFYYCYFDPKESGMNDHALIEATEKPMAERLIFFHWSPVLSRYVHMRKVNNVGHLALLRRGVPDVTDKVHEMLQKEMS